MTIISSGWFEVKHRRKVWKVCDDLVFLSVTIWCCCFFFFFLNRPWFSYLQKEGENTSQYCNIYNECDILLRSQSQNGGMQQKRVQTELCANELQALFPLFSTQHNTLSSCHDDTRTFTMQHRFQMSEQTDRNTAWLFLAFAHKQYIPPSFNYLMNTGGNSSLSEVWKRFWGFKKKINKSNWTTA